MDRLDVFLLQNRLTCARRDGNQNNSANIRWEQSAVQGCLYLQGDLGRFFKLD